MNKPCLHVPLSLLICLILPLTATAQVVDIPDPNLRAAIENALGKPAGASITVDEMATLTHLKARNANISDLTGLQHAINLIELSVGDEYVESADSWLNSNSIEDLSPLAELTNLQSLNLSQNNISDLSPLADLTNLQWVDIGGNNLSNISPVAGLSNLTALRLWRNNIEDISPVAGLIHLTELNLHHNNISDLSPIVANTGLGSGDEIDVRGNPLSSTSIKTHIPVLQNRGVTVKFDDRLSIPIPSDVPFADVPFDVTNIPEPVPPPKEVRDFFQLDPYYQQWINVRGFPVFASEEVSPYALKEAAWILGHMIGHRPDVLRVMAERTARFAIVPHNKHTSDMPESNTGRLSFFLDVRYRDVYCRGCPIASEDEEDLIGKSASPIHNFGHLLQDWGLNGIDPTFNNRVTTLYDMAKAEGLYQGYYAGSTESEYWAEGVTSWFHDTNQKQHVALTRSALKKYDSRLAKLLTEVFGDGDWRYTRPATRTHLPHLKGFNPQEAPIYQRPPELLELEQQLRDPNSDGGGKWVNLKLYDPSALSHLKKLITGRNRTDFIFGNLTGTDLTLYTVDDDGKKTPRYYSTTADFTPIGAHVGAIWLIQDHTGNDLAIFRAEEEVGRVLVTPTPFLIIAGLSKVSGDNQSGVAGAVLTNPLVIEVRDDNLSVLEGISVTFTVTTGDGRLSTTRTTTDENGRAESTFTLGSSRGKNTVSVSATGIEGTVTFNAVTEAAVDIPDANLRAAIETTLDKAKGDPITPSEMATLTRLEARNANISDLTGLQHAINLIELSVGDEYVESADSWLNSNSIKDLSPIAGLTNLQWLNLSQNNISDISPIAGLTNLTYMNIGGNNLSNISPVAGLSNLTALRLWRNNIVDISPVADLILLTGLNLHHNSISDLSPLVANTGLGSGDEVDVRGNPLSYQSIHTHIPALKSRGVTVEFDMDRTRPPDVNGDGNVNVLDLISIASVLGNTGENLAMDVNGDGVVNVLDIVLVGGMFEHTAD